LLSGLGSQLCRRLHPGLLLGFRRFDLSQLIAQVGHGTFVPFYRVTFTNRPSAISLEGLRDVMDGLANFFECAASLFSDR
jgi:hypothetical protein